MQMANKHICSKLNVIRKMRLKELWNTTTHLLEWQKYWAQTTGNANKDVEWEKPHIHYGWESKRVQTVWKTVWCFLKKLRIYIYFSKPKIPRYYLPKRMENYPQTRHQKTYTWMFLAVLFKIATTWNQSWYSSGSEWINWDIFRQWNIIQW